jgi:hypothetical protein
VSLVKAAALNLGLGVATVWLTWLTARRVGSIHQSGGVVGMAHPTMAGLIVACDPILLNQQTLVMTESLSASLAILALWCLARFDATRSWFNASLAGGAIGLAVLCRPTFLPWLCLVGIAMLLVCGRNSEFRIQNSERHWLSDLGWRVSNSAGLLIAAVVVMSPWAIRNYRVFGKPIVTTTHGGYTLLLGNNSSFYNWLAKPGPRLPWKAEEINPLEDDYRRYVDDIDSGLVGLRYGPEAELRADRRHYEVAMSNMRRSPTRFMAACAYRLAQLWSPLPHKLTTDESVGRRLLRYATCAWYCGVYLLAVVGVWRLRWRLVRPPWVWGMLLCLAFTAVHTFYWTNLRMRAPLVPFVALVAAVGAPRGLCFSMTKRREGYAEA